MPDYDRNDTRPRGSRSCPPPNPPGTLEIRNVSKAFPNVQALNDVSLDIRPGEILAFMGENGAGKSTLLKIINGDYQPDTGTLTIDGQRLVFSNPYDAHKAGIRVIYQEPEIIPGVDVAENIWVGELPKRLGLLDRRQLNAQVQRSLAEYGFENILPIQLLGDQLSSAQRQLVEIMRALKSGVRVLALDEPTSSLTDEEVDRLFTLVRRLRDEGVAIIYVSHRIKEILRLCDRVAILRDGDLVAVQPAAELNDAEIVRLMVGRELSDVFKRRPAGTDREVLRVEDLHSNWHQDISFHINAGEVVGFAGLVGAGRTELAKVIFGELPKDSGRVTLDGQDVTIRRPDDAIAKGHRLCARRPQARGPGADPQRAGKRLAWRSCHSSAASTSCAGAWSGPLRRDSSRSSACARPPSNRKSASSPAATSRRSCWRAGWRRDPRC